MIDKSTDERALRIGLYSPALPESASANGIVTYVRIMRDALRGLGHAVTIVTTEAIECSDGRIIEVPQGHKIAFRLRMLLSGGRQDGAHPALRQRVLDAVRAARGFGLDVLEIEESFGWAGFVARRGVPIVMRLHGPHVFVRDELETAAEKLQGDRRLKAEQRAFSRVQAVTSPTRSLIDAMVPHGLDEAISNVIPNPMPITKGPGWSLEGADLNRILFIGRFDICKGADVAIRAFAHAASRIPHLRLVMAGPDRGIRLADATRSHFEEFVVSELAPELRSQVSFLGPQPPARLAELRRSCGLSLITSRFETFSYVLAEAMAIGMPVVASHCFGPSEIVEDGVSGRLVPVSDAQATGNAIIEMLADPSQLAEIGQGARRRVRNLLAPDRIAQATVDVYREAITRMRNGW